MEVNIRNYSLILIGFRESDVCLPGMHVYSSQSYLLYH